VWVDVLGEEREKGMDVESSKDEDEDEDAESEDSLEVKEDNEVRSAPLGWSYGDRLDESG